VVVRGGSIEGLWVVLVDQEEDKVPLLARAGNGLYLLAFRDGQRARRFIADSELDAAEARLVVKSNLAMVLAALETQHAAGVLVDYDARTNTYREAGLVY
jgi:hypothetical protein